MGKLRKIFRKIIDRMIEKSFQRQADKLFMKHKVNIEMEIIHDGAV